MGGLLRASSAEGMHPWGLTIVSSFPPSTLQTFLIKGQIRQERGSKRLPNAKTGKNRENNLSIVLWRSATAKTVSYIQRSIPSAAENCERFFTLRVGRDTAF
jgi:hypothetical protein